jgi:hypothetical protein
MTPEREQQAMAETGAFNQRLIDGGHFVYANGISGPEEAVLVDNRDGASKVSKERYIKSSQYLGGFWVVNFDDDETAQNWALDASKACHQTVEVRRFHS